jgi:hypothetical protein
VLRITGRLVKARAILRDSQKSRSIIGAIALILNTFAMPALVAHAAQLTSVSLAMSDQRTGASNNYTFSASNFTTGTSLKCITLSFNTAADGSGSVPGSFSNASTTLASSTLITAGSWSQDNSTNGTLKLTDSGGENPAANGNIVWNTITNGATASTTYYAIINTWTNTGCTTPSGGTYYVTIAFVWTAGQLVTINVNPSLTFTVAGVTTSSYVNNQGSGTQTNVGTTSTTIPLGTVTTSTNGVGAQDLSASTNAAGGLEVYIRYTAKPTDAGAATIADSSGTNASPATFAGAGTEAFGYTTNVSPLSASSTRFSNSGAYNLYAKFTTSNGEIGYLSGAGTQNSRIGFQAGISATTPAGAYSTTVIYTATPTY